MRNNVADAGIYDVWCLGGAGLCSGSVSPRWVLQRLWLRSCRVVGHQCNFDGTLFGGEATRSLEGRSVWAAGWMEADLMRHVSEAALPQCGRNETLVLLRWVGDEKEGQRWVPG